MRIVWPPELVRWIRRLHRVAVYPVLAVALPTPCFVCGKLLGAVQRLGACAACWADLRALRPPLCAHCGLALPAGTDLWGPAGGRCAACILRPPVVDAVRAVVAYDTVARAFLLRAKLGCRAELLGPLGLQLARTVVCASWATGCTAVVPVPSHPWAEWRRGFSPGLEFARPVARATGLPLWRGTLGRRWAGDLALKRLGARARRTRASRTIRVRRSVCGARLLLVDDVMTTGATVDACARALKRSGATEVRVAVWARTPPRP